MAYRNETLLWWCEKKNFNKETLLELVGVSFSPCHLIPTVKANPAEAINCGTPACSVSK